jgi:hypothetical protein
MSERKGEYLARLLIRHNIILRAALDDSEGYDGGHTLAALVKASEELGIDKLRAEIERLKAELRDERGLTDENYSKIELERNMLRDQVTQLKAQLATAEKREMEKAIKRELAEARLETECLHAKISMIVARLGGIVEGRPTGAHNLLQRIDILIREEILHAEHHKRGGTCRNKEDQR